LTTFGLTDLPLFAAFALTYRMYTSRVKKAGTLVDEPFGKTQGMLFGTFPLADAVCHLMATS